MGELCKRTEEGGLMMKQKQKLLLKRQKLMKT